MAVDRDETQPFLPPIDGTDDPTLLMPRTAVGHPAAGGAGRPGGVALVAGGGPQWSTVANSLRKTRLRAAAWFLIGMQWLFLVWRVAFGGGELWWLNLAMIAGLGASPRSFLCTRRGRPPSGGSGGSRGRSSA